MSSCSANGLCYLDNRAGLIVLAASSLLFLAIVVRRAGIVMVAIAGLSLANIATAPKPLFVQTRAVDHDRFLLAHDTNSALERYGDVRIWFDTKEPMTATYTTVAAMHLWLYRLVTNSFPSLVDFAGKPVVPELGKPIAVMTQNPDA